MDRDRVKPLKKRKKIKVSASFMDPTIKAQLKPSVERQIKYKILEMCYARGKSRGIQQSWLDISNSFLKTSEDQEKSVFYTHYTSSPLLPKPKLPKILPEKQMFILISEKEVEGIEENKYDTYYKTETIINHHTPLIKPIKSQKDFKKYVPVPLKKFNPEIIPSLRTKTPAVIRDKSLRKFKF